MSDCKHKSLVLLPGKKNRIRCKHCHLTIKVDDLEKDYCPECFEVRGKRLYDFEEITDAETDSPQYRCENCGLIIPGD